MYRIILSIISRLFDPLGFVCPVVISLKCIFQDAWRLQLGWNQVVPETMASEVRLWIKGLHQLREWQIPRVYFPAAWRDVVDHCELHCFGDASLKAYGACVFLRATMLDGTQLASLVIAKGRVAPLKNVSLPRLELLAAVECARLSHQVKTMLKLPESAPVFCWSDSQVVLFWINSRGQAGKQQYVEVRVGQIQCLTEVSCWRYCPSDANPADHITRGVPVDFLMNDRTWLHGPDFDSLLSREQPQFSSEVVCLNVKEDVVLPVLPVERWGSYTKCIRVVAWLLRWQSPPEQSSDLSFLELKRAKLVLFREIQRCFFPSELKCLQEQRPLSKGSKLLQLNPFLDEDGLMRVGSRLEMAEFPYEAKYPILLPKCHLSSLIAKHVHRVLHHAGVNSMLVRLREEFWIIGARRLCRSVKASCVACQRVDAPCLNQRMAPLQKTRVSQSPPFSVVGIDHAGPLHASDTDKKLYILLFTCASIRAVHLELVDSLSATSTVLALRRFVARRGKPSKIFSDNAKGFVSAKAIFCAGADAPSGSSSYPVLPGGVAGGREW